ncbi:ABC transporter permease [Rickettsiales bacterium]|nr:ABC transporter permease [Rickettsiales bacterium]
MLTRIFAMLFRYKILVLGSLPRVLSIFYWPSIQIILWGFFSNFLISIEEESTKSSLSFLLSAVILWDVLFRGQLGLSMTFFEELWSRNLGNIMISPLRNYELILSLIIVSLFRTCLGLIPAVFVANFFFEFHIFELGVYLILFFFNLILMGWTIGFFVSGLVLRFGQAFEELAWAIIFVILPFSCVYYPLEILPLFFQKISLFLPPIYIFEGMRSILINNYFDLSLFFKVMIINLIYFIFSILFFLKMIDLSREKGSLMNYGE